VDGDHPCVHRRPRAGQANTTSPVRVGEVRQVHNSDQEPDGVLLKACGTPREARCPSCAATSRADAYQLLAVGLNGDKGAGDAE
jgi:hypothetical protein